MFNTSRKKKLRGTEGGKQKCRRYPNSCIFYFFTNRVMDAFLIDGMEIIFRLAVAILNFGKEDLLSLDMEGMLKVQEGH